MSKMRSYGKGRNNSRAGLQFDKLLKSVSNSKKNPAAMAVGALGRFGVPHFTSTRSCLEHLGSEDPEERAPSRFSSFKKRARIEPLQPPNLQDDTLFAAHISLAQAQAQAGNNNGNDGPPVLTPQSVLKPRKFFKSRGPMEVDLQPVPLRPDVSKLIPQSPLSNLNTPVKQKHKQQGLGLTTPPSIKIKIIKDKKTSKFVSVSEGREEEEEGEESPVKGKRGRKKRKHSEEEKEERKGRGRPRTKEKEKEEESDKPALLKPLIRPPNPMRAKGRVTRSSAKFGEKEEDGHDEEKMVKRVEQEEEGEVKPTKVSMQELEEDAEFRKISQMLSSLEGEEEEEEEAVAVRRSPSHSPQQQQQQQSFSSPLGWEREESSSKSNKAQDTSTGSLGNDIVNDWDLSFEEEGGGAGGRVSSPPKVSRFDPTAFQVPGSSPTKEDRDYRDSGSNPSRTASQQEQESSFFNENASPYSMKNLLEKPKDELEAAAGQKPFPLPLEPEQVLSGSSQETCSQSSSDSGLHSQSQQSQAFSLPKKASIFKSRSSKQEKKAVYKHTFHGQEEEKKAEPERPVATTLFSDFDEETPDLSQESGVGQGPEGGKRLITRVKNVKATHELQESGEVHEFDGDILYIMEDLKSSNPVNNRCLSAVTMAAKCMDPAFRMHLRAHGTVSEFCRELEDAPKNETLSLLAAVVLFVLSQDRLNLDLDTETLGLIVALMRTDFRGETDSQAGDPVTGSTRQRVLELCDELRGKGHTSNLDLGRMTPSEVALETLIYLTSKRAGNWVKELRVLGGLDAILSQVETAFEAAKAQDGSAKEIMLELKKIEKCLGVLGQVTFNQEDNQRYLLQVGKTKDPSGAEMACPPCSPQIFIEMFQFSCAVLEKEEGEYAKDFVSMHREVMFQVLRLLLNLSHDYRGIVVGSEVILSIEGFLDLALHSVFELPKCFPEEKVFDLLVHSLCILINLVDTSKRNREVLLGKRWEGSGKDLLDSLISMFLEREENAREDEKHTDTILDKKPAPRAVKSKEKDEEGPETESDTDKLIQAAGKHMENSLIAAYISLLIAFLIKGEDKHFVERVKSAMPDGSFLRLMVVLKKLFDFMSITSADSGSTRGLRATAEALKFYQSVDPESSLALKKMLPE